eukprot:1751160-Rhodomonas_salina.1
MTQEWGTISAEYAGSVGDAANRQLRAGGKVALGKTDRWKARILWCWARETEWKVLKQQQEVFVRSRIGRGMCRRVLHALKFQVIWSRYDRTHVRGALRRRNNRTLRQAMFAWFSLSQDVRISRSKRATVRALCDSKLFARNQVLSARALKAWQATIKMSSLWKARIEIVDKKTRKQCLSAWKSFTQKCFLLARSLRHFDARRKWRCKSATFEAWYDYSASKKRRSLLLTQRDTCRSRRVMTRVMQGLRDAVLRAAKTQHSRDRITNKHNTITQNLVFSQWAKAVRQGMVEGMLSELEATTVQQ